MRRAIVALAMVCALTRAASAQVVSVAQSAPAAALPGSEITVSLLTFGSHELIFERFGHNALRFQDASTGEDVAYHWGLFGFNEPDFLKRFLTGETNYWMGGEPALSLIGRETGRGRHTTIQRLNLTPLQAFKLRDFVRWNALEENKFYRYDYYVDNCSTRLRDALDRALGGTLKQAKDTISTGISYRRESVRVTPEPYRGGIDVALGRPADALLSEWESYFIPMRLRDGLRSMTVTTDAGAQVPLVADEQVLALPVGMVARVESERAPRLAPGYLLVGLLVAGVFAALGTAIRSRPRGAAAIALAVSGAVWSLACGVLGVILLLAWTATKHQFWALNENALLLTPFSLALAVLVPVSILRGSKQRAARMLALVVVVLGAVALVLAALPGGQENRAIVALILPTHLALAWALIRTQPGSLERSTS